MHTTTHRNAGDRRGIALLMALGAIVIIGAIVAGSFIVSTRDLRANRSSAAHEEAQLRAEDALNSARESLNMVEFSNAAVGSSSLILSPAGNSARLVKLSAEAGMLTAIAGAGGGSRADSARRRASMLLVRRVPDMDFPGALTVNGAIQIGGASEIDGTDRNPASWACAAPGLAKPGLVLGVGDTPSYSGCKNGVCLDGNPPLLNDPVADNPDTYFKYGSTTWNDLVADASPKLPGGNYKIEPAIANGRCNPGVATNWGDPTRSNPKGACEDYFPVIYIAGDATLNGNMGQGVLLVEGDLSVQGGFEFFGPVIVKGSLKTTGTGGHFNGGVMAANVDLEANKVLGNAVVSYSSCALQTALRMSSPLRPVRQRAWADLY
jgi:hypothetical protein